MMVCVWFYFGVWFLYVNVYSMVLFEVVRKMCVIVFFKLLVSDLMCVFLCLNVMDSVIKFLYVVLLFCIFCNEYFLGNDVFFVARSFRVARSNNSYVLLFVLLFLFCVFVFLFVFVLFKVLFKVLFNVCVNCVCVGVGLFVFCFVFVVVVV